MCSYNRLTGITDFCEGLVAGHFAYLFIYLFVCYAIKLLTDIGDYFADETSRGSI